MLYNTHIEHNKSSVLREYCRARRIPFRVFENGKVYIDNKLCCTSLDIIPWAELIAIIDRLVEYKEDGNFKCLK